MTFVQDLVIVVIVIVTVLLFRRMVMMMSVTMTTTTTVMVLMMWFTTSLPLAVIVVHDVSLVDVSRKWNVDDMMVGSSSDGIIESDDLDDVVTEPHTLTHNNVERDDR